MENTNNSNNGVLKTVDKQKVDMWLKSNQKFFPSEKIVLIREKLYKLTDDKFSMVSCVELKDPTTLLLVSILVGGLGIDRFLLKDTGMGVLKLLTGGGCGLLWLIDCFSIQNKTRELNFNNLFSALVLQ